MSAKSKTAALVLSMFTIGGDRAYACGWGQAVAKSLTAPLTMGLWQVWDFLVLLVDALAGWPTASAAYCKGIEWDPASIKNAQIVAIVMACLVGLGVIGGALGGMHHVRARRRRRREWENAI